MYNDTENSKSKFYHFHSTIKMLTDLINKKKKMMQKLIRCLLYKNSVQNIKFTVMLIRKHFVHTLCLQGYTASSLLTKESGIVYSL